MKVVEQEDLDVERHGFYRWTWKLLKDAFESINNMFTDLYARRMFNALYDGHLADIPEYILLDGGATRVGKPESGTYLGSYVIQIIITSTGFAGTEDVDWKTVYTYTP